MNNCKKITSLSPGTSLAGSQFSTIHVAWKYKDWVLSFIFSHRVTFFKTLLKALNIPFQSLFTSLLHYIHDKNDHWWLKWPYANFHENRNFFKISQNFGFSSATARGLIFFGNFFSRLNHNDVTNSQPDAAVRSVSLYGVLAMRQKWPFRAPRGWKKFFSENFAMYIFKEL